jgi:hypothetical protein
MPTLKAQNGPLRPRAEQPVHGSRSIAEPAQPSLHFAYPL